MLARRNPLTPTERAELPRLRPRRPCPLAHLSRKGDIVTHGNAAEDHASVVEPPTALQLPDLGRPPARNSFRIESGANVITRDGATLLDDHYIPETDEPRGTILVRSSYGRGFPKCGLGMARLRSRRLEFSANIASPSGWAARCQSGAA